MTATVVLGKGERSATLEANAKFGGSDQEGDLYEVDVKDRNELDNLVSEVLREAEVVGTRSN